MNEQNPEPLPRRLPRRDGAAPGQPASLPRRDGGGSGQPASLPRRDGGGSGQPASLPRRDGGGSGQPASLPRRDGGGSGQPDDLPRRLGGVPDYRGLPDSADLPRRGGDLAGPGDALPRRTSRVRRVGRHRSPHRLSVASDAPALILAVPAPASGHTRELAESVAAVAADSCPGAQIRIGYLGDGPDNLADLLAEIGPGDAASAVIVPLLASPYPEFDHAIEAIAGTAPVLLADHLGPHPLLAAALHDRLAERGLARAGRARGLNIATGADGILVVADRGPEAAASAAVAAVLLAGRLAVPVAPAVLDDRDGIDAAVRQLHEARALNLAISPCVIGPESNPAEFERLSVKFGAPCAAPLGAHPAIAQLVAVRYGEALATIAVPG